MAALAAGWQTEPLVLLVAADIHVKSPLLRAITVVALHVLAGVKLL
jgi:hypothetical protein